MPLDLGQILDFSKENHKYGRGCASDLIRFFCLGNCRISSVMPVVFWVAAVDMKFGPDGPAMRIPASLLDP